MAPPVPRPLAGKSVFPFLFLCLAGFCGLFFPLCGHGKTPYPFAVESERLAQTHRLVARNRGPAPVSVKIQLVNTENVAADQTWPLYAVVRPYGESHLATIRAARPELGYRFSTQVSYMPGNFHARHDNQARYRLPFGQGRSFVVSQAADGPLSTHNSPDSQYAVDITMPEGTPILAARPGVVIETEAGQRFGARQVALANSANFVRILHDDETTATYAHLAFQSVPVRPGDRVAAGAVIGRAGSTGYSSGPHLHFVVQELIRRGETFQALSVPFQFTVGQPPHAFFPQTRQQLTDDETPPGQPPIQNPNTRHP